MPNWCTTTILIAGDKYELKNLQELITKWINRGYTKHGFGKLWLGNAVLGAGFKVEDFECRGLFAYIGEVYESDVSLFEFVTSTAWEPMIEMWEAIVEKYAPHSKIYWYAEEPGTELYFSNDKNHDFIKAEYAVECILDEENSDFVSKAGFINGIETYKKEDLTNALRKIYGHKSLNEMLLLVEKDTRLRGYDYFKIHKINFV